MYSGAVPLRFLTLVIVCIHAAFGATLYAQTPVPLHVEDSPAYRALLRLESYLQARSAGLKPGWIFGPNNDDCYFYRIRHTDVSEYLTEAGDTPQRIFALANGIPSLKSIPPAERLAFFTANYRGRRTGVRDSIHILCLKHFPGGSRLLENTEQIAAPVVFNESLADWCDRLQPFEYAMAVPPGVTAIMTSHACYPGLEADLRERHPGIRTWMKPNTLCPATFSPFILQGLLRRDMGYNGVIVTDWVDMGAVFRFLLDYRKSLPAVYSGLSDDALVFVLSLDAGCHFVTGIQLRRFRMTKSRDMNPCIREITRYYTGDSSRLEILNTRFSEAAASFAAGGFMPAEANVVSLLTIPAEDKVRFLIGEEPRNASVFALKRFSTKQFQDLWNRQSLLHLQLRAYYLEERFGIALPELPYRGDDERIVSQDTNYDWLLRITGSPEYQKYAGSIDWQSPQSSGSWERALLRFLAE